MKNEYKKQIAEISKRQNNSEVKLCAYCGAPAQCKDHPIPLTYFDADRDTANQIFKASGWHTIDSCNSCNTLAGYSLDKSFAERKIVILERFKQKFKKNLKAKPWSEKDLKELDYSLKSYIEEAIMFDEFIKIRFENLSNPFPIFFD